LDPLYYETAFSKIEGDIAPILRVLNQERRAPSAEELDILLSFTAVMFARVPAFRPFILGVEESIHRGYFLKALENPDIWKDTLIRAGISVDAPGASYEEMLRFERKGYALSAENDWYLHEGFKAADKIIPVLRTRHWNTQVSPSGSFIASDNPVAMDGPPGQMVGFKSAEVVIFPVCRHVLLCGTNVRVRQSAINRRQIAAHNTFTMLTADDYVYSHRPDFCWTDPNGNYQTDWNLFVKEDFDRVSSTDSDRPGFSLYLDN
jgi:hypothetical protein